jgi:hypothetical protein
MKKTLIGILLLLVIISCKEIKTGNPEPIITVTGTIVWVGSDFNRESCIVEKDTNNRYYITNTKNYPFNIEIVVQGFVEDEKWTSKGNVYIKKYLILR